MDRLVLLSPGRPVCPALLPHEGQTHLQVSISHLYRPAKGRMPGSHTGSPLSGQGRQGVKAIS